MLEAQEYLPIGSVILLKNGAKKLMIIGVMPNAGTNEQIEKEFDYIGVLYPEGFINVVTLLMFNHDQIAQVFYRGFEDSERDAFLQRVTLNREHLEAWKAGLEENVHTSEAEK